VALGNAPFNENIVSALNEKLSIESELVKEHLHWAITQQIQKEPQD